MNKKRRRLSPTFNESIDVPMKIYGQLQIYLFKFYYFSEES